MITAENKTSFYSLFDEALFFSCFFVLDECDDKSELTERTLAPK